MIRLLLLGVAVLAGGVLLKAAHDKPGALSVDDAVQTVRPGADAAVRAAGAAGELAGTLSKAADTGWTAAKDTAGMVGDAVDAGSRLIGVEVPKLGGSTAPRAPARQAEPPAAQPAAQQARVPAPAPVSYRAPTSRAAASEIVPLEQAVPESQQGQQ